MLENSQPILLNSLIYSKLLGTATTTGFGNGGYSLSVTPTLVLQTRNHPSWCLPG